MSFIKRVLEITITLGAGELGENVGEVVTLRNYGATVSIEAYGGEHQGTLHARIYGVGIDLINQLTTIGTIKTGLKGKNRIRVDAGNEGDALSEVYEGAIFDAWGDFSGAPDCSLNIMAMGSADLAIKPFKAASFSGENKVSDMLASLAAQAGIGFQNNGIETSLSDQHLHGSALDQIKTVAKNANINFIIENGRLDIWPKDGFRDLPVPSVSPSRGLVGYPSFSSNGILITTEFLPMARIGRKILLEDSQVIQANGEWIIYTVSHTLSSVTQNGEWFTFVECWSRG